MEVNVPVMVNFCPPTKISALSAKVTLVKEAFPFADKLPFSIYNVPTVTTSEVCPSFPTIIPLPSERFNSVTFNSAPL